MTIIPFVIIGVVFGGLAVYFFCWARRWEACLRDHQRALEAAIKRLEGTDPSR